MTNPPVDSPVAIAFDLGAIKPPKPGFCRWVLAKGERLISHAMVIPKGGEPDFHAHLHEDHLFLVIDGEAQFEFVTEQESIRLGRLQALFIPDGCYYRFCSVGDQELVFARVGTTRGPDAQRIILDGTSLDL